MREAHREAARHLYEERNKDNGPNPRELYVDLHGTYSLLLSQHESLLTEMKAFILKKQYPTSRASS
jgi:hypothetical protein